MPIEYESFLEILKRQAAAYINASKSFKTLYPSFLERIRLGIKGLQPSIESTERFWQNTLELQVKQVAAELDGDLQAAAKIVGQTYEQELAKNGLSLAKLKNLLPSDINELLGFSKFPNILARARDFVFELLDFKRGDILTPTEVGAARVAGAGLPAGAAFALGATALAIPLYLFLRSKTQNTIDEIDKINEDIAKTQIIFKNRKVITIDNKNPSNIISSQPITEINPNAELGTPENPITPENVKQWITKKVKRMTIKTPSTNELTNLALNKVAGFINEIPSRLDFEIASKTNPTDVNGNVTPGKYIILRVYLKSGAYVKNKFADIILRSFGAGEKALTSKEEQPIEDTLRNAVKDIPIIPTQTTTPASTTPASTTPASTTQRPFIRFAGSPNIFDRQTGKYISYAEAASLGVYGPNKIEDISTPRPEVHIGTDYALWDGKDLTMGVAGIQNAPSQTYATIIDQIKNQTDLSNLDLKNNSANADKLLNELQAMGYNRNEAFALYYAFANVDDSQLRARAELGFGNWEKVYAKFITYQNYARYLVKGGTPIS